MKPTKMIWGVFIILGMVILGACNMPSRATPTAEGAGLIYTAAAQTVAAQMTEISKPPATAAGETPVAVLPTDTSAPPAAPTDTPPPPTAILATSTPVPTATPIPCDRVSFEKDVTIPDNTEMSPGEKFVKTWRLRNAGSCTWTTSYALVFAGGDGMNGLAAVSLAGSVGPGQTVDVSVSLTAPDTGGTYRGDWMLRNASNVVFGLGDGTKPFWVQIKVKEISGLVYDFLVQAPKAEWVSSVDGNPGTTLTFGAPADDDPNGVAKIKDAVKLETGANSGKILLMFPRHDSDGVISGLFPAYTVQSGDVLKAKLGFMMNPDTLQCGTGEVKFQITYKEGGTLKLLKEWTKTCSGSFTDVNIDLTSLKGKSIQFGFVVMAEGSFKDDWAIWNSPRIEH